MPRKKGRRQRLKDGGLQGATSNSHLVQWLLGEWSWGHLSPQQVQKIADLARRDMQIVLEHGVIPAGVEQMASLGGQSHNPSNMNRDLLSRLGENPYQLRKVPIPLAGHGLTPVLQDMLLPHEVVAKMFHFNNCVEERQQAFWIDWIEAGDVLGGRDPTMALPLTLHGDAVPVVGVWKSWQKSLDVLN